MSYSTATDVPVSAEGLTFVWEGPDGSIWDLGRGTEGVVLATDLSDFGLSGMEHQTTATGAWTGVHRHPVEPTLAVRIGHKLRGQERLDLIRRWWTRANSPYNTGRLYVIQPSGETRFIEARLRDAPDVTYQFDPALNIDYIVEPWLLTTSSPWWNGVEQTMTYDMSGTRHFQPIFGRDEDKPAWGLYISGYGYNEISKQFTNNGDGPMYLKWIIQGPAQDVTLEMNGHRFVYSGIVEPHERVELVTEPGKVSAINYTSAGTRNVIGNLTETLSFPPVPRARDVNIKMSSKVLTPETVIQAVGSEKWGLPF